MQAEPSLAYERATVESPPESEAAEHEEPPHCRRQVDRLDRGIVPESSTTPLKYLQGAY